MKIQLPLRILKYLGVLLLTAALLAVLGWGLARLYEPELKEIAVYELNRHLAVQVAAGDIDLSLIRHFPNASLRFSDVVVPSTTNPSDTCLYVENLYLKLGLLSLLRKHYTLTEASAIGGFVKMELFNNGTDNYHFWKDAEEPEGEASIELKSFVLSRIQYHLTTESGEQVQVLIEKLALSGSFTDAAFALNADLTAHVKQVYNDGTLLFSQMPTSGVLQIAMEGASSSGKQLHIESDKLKIGKESFVARSTFGAGADGGWECRLSTSGASIGNLLALAPISVQESLGQYRSEGKSDLAVQLASRKKGAMDIDILFEKTKGSLKHQSSSGRAKIASAAGSLQVRNGRTSLYLDGLKASLGPGEISATGKIINFDAPAFDLHINGTVDLAELRDFLNMSMLDLLQGKLTLNGSLKGKLKQGQKGSTLSVLRGMDFFGEIALRNGAFRLLNQEQLFDKIEGDFALQNNALSVERAAARVNKNPFVFSGSIYNALPFLTSADEKLHLAADFEAKELNFNEILTQSESRKDTTYMLSLPENISFVLGVKAERATFRKFEAKDINGRAFYQNGLLTVNPVTFQTAAGTLQATLRLSRKDEKNYLSEAVAELKGISLDKLFTQFEDFGQDVVKSKHLEGRADLRIQFSSDMSASLKLDNSTVKAYADIIVTNGKLKRLEALQGIPDYLRQNPVWNTLVRVKEFERRLQNIEFDTLRNTIQIQNSVVTIPTMAVRSSAMGINISGTHHFDNRINYAVNFRLGDLLRTGKKSSDEFGYIAEDASGLRLFLLMTGTAENPVFSVDKDGARQKRRLELQREKNTFKSILREEFGLFKGDTTLQGVPQKPAKPTTKVEVEWDASGNEKKPDSQSKDSKKQPARKNKPSKNDSDLYDALESDDDL